MPRYREDQALIHVAVNGVALPIEPWQTFEGGDIEAQNVNTRPGGMAPAIEMGGPTTRSDVTITKLYDSVLHALLIKLENVAGKAEMKASYTPLDADGNPEGETITLTGILKTVSRPNYDATASAAQKLSLVMGCNQEATGSSN